MDSRTSILISLGTLLAAIALAVLGLAADNASYFDSHRDSAVDVHYIRWNSSAEAQYSYWLKLDYAPSQFTLNKEHGQIAAGVVCAVVGAIVAVGAWFARGQTSAKTEGPMKRFLPAALASGTVAFVISLAIAVYSWQSPMKWSIDFKKSIPLPPVVSDPSKEPPTTYNSPFPYTPEAWNCLLSPYVVGSPSSRMQTLCEEAKVAKYLMVPLVIASVFLVGVLGWSMWQTKKVNTDEVEMAAPKDVDAVSVETASVQTKD